MTKEELEKEAGDYADEHAFRVPYDGSNKFYDDVDFKASKEGYLAGAEPREKRIAELEKENAELREKYLQATDEGTSFAHLKSLERENAELKETIVDIEKNFRICESNADTHYDQLTKAKEIIRDLLFLVIASQIKTIESDEIKEQAKQFLKEIEK